MKNFLSLALLGLVFILNTSIIYSKITFIEVKYPLLGEESVPGIPWPKPQQMSSSGKEAYCMCKSRFSMITNLNGCDLIEQNILHYMNVIFPPKIYSEVCDPTHEMVLSELNIEIKENVCPGYPHPNMDESYTIKIINGGAHLKANTAWGALRGLETFSQLTYFIDVNGIQKLVINDNTVIQDFPRFSYRGLMLDTSRHFIPVPLLRKQIDGMAYNKFNVFHWHIVDDQSFPYQSKKYPDLSKNGAYSPVHTYSQEQIKTIIDHARLRGIRVIPEFDSPGHVNAFGKTFPQFITVCWANGKPFQAIYSVQGKAEILNPTLEYMYPVLENILAELKDVFPDEYIHLGNDEVYYDCWKSNPDIQSWMKAMNFTDFHHLEAYFSSKLLSKAKKLKKKVNIWQDVYDNGVQLDKSTVIQIWKDTSILPEHKKWYEYLSDITKNGYQAILSSPWYINFISYGYQEWYKFYQVEPLANFTGTPEQAKLIIGGETALWTEYVDGTNLESRLWPRASAIAERLWSASNVNDPEEAKFRLDEHRCRLLRRGIPATPILNGYCGDYEYGMEKSVIFHNSFNYGWPSC